MATRFYLSNTEAGPAGTFTFATWGESASAVRRTMDPSLTTDPLTTVAVPTVSPGNSELHRQLIGAPMAAGIAFTTSDTYSIQIQGLESAANDNVMNRNRALRVFSQDGSTVRATLKGLGAAAITTEWPTTLTNLQFGNAVTLTNGYTTVAGDRLVLELGHGDSAGTTVSASLRWGRDASATGDLGVNETDTTSTLRPWFEISRTITFLSTAAALPVPRRPNMNHLLGR